jgi:transcription antitermination factor NusG
MRSDTMNDHPWYALRVRTRHEKAIAALLEEKRYETFLPLYTTRRRWSDRMKELELALFPGYVFCRFDINRRLPILTTPGVMEVVGSGQMFIPVDDSEIQSLKVVAASPVSVEPWPYHYIGQRVRVDCGPLEGVEGLLLNVKNQERLVLSVTLLQRSVAVEIDQRWVRPVNEVLTRSSFVYAPAVGI